ncbi:MAG: hypothetical protein K6G32_08875 [Prevotella sp.]|nr:hypothetical protein [Prevotella sp.]
MKRFKLLTLLLLTAATFLLSSCFFFDNPLDDNNGRMPIPGVGSAVTENADNYEITYQFKDGVIVLDEQTMQYLVKVVNDNILYFASNTPADIMPKVGSIISARITEKTPYGLGNKVLSVTNEDGMVKCVTDVAALDEIFEVLELTSETSLLSLFNGNITDEEGNVLETKIEQLAKNNNVDSPDENPVTRASIGSPEVLSVYLPYKSDHGLFAKLKLSLGVILTANISFKNRTFEFSKQDFAGFGGTVGLEGEYDSNDSHPIPLLKTQLFTGVLAFGPIVLRPYVDVDSYLSCKAKGTFEAGFYKDISMKYGWTEKGPFFDNTTNNDDNFFNELSLNGRLGFGPTLKMDFGAGLYTKNVAIELRPKVEAEIGGELDLSNQNIFKLRPAMYLDIVAGVEGGFIAEILKWELASFDIDFLELNLLNLSWPLLPDYVDNSLKVVKRGDSSPAIFDASYSVTGSSLGKLLGVKPIVRVYNGASLCYDVYNALGANLPLIIPTTLNYELSNIQKNVTYTAKPAFEIAGFKFEGDGVDFIDKEEEEEEPIPEEIRDDLEKYMPIYDGINPPNIEGTYYVDPDVVVQDGTGDWSPGHIINSYYFNFFNQDMINNTVDIRRRSSTGSHTEQGNGVFIRGTGNNFTVYFNNTGVSSGINIKTSVVVSGTKTETGIKDLYYSFVILEKGADPNHLLINVGVSRIFKDGNGMSVPTSWPAAVRSKNVINEDYIIEELKGSYYFSK